MLAQGRGTCLTVAKAKGKRKRGNLVVRAVNLFIGAEVMRQFHL